MRNKILATAFLALFAVAPAYAQDMKCDKDSMTKMNADVKAMEAGEGQTMAMKQMEKADKMMAANDMDGCMKHMQKAMDAMKK